MLKPFRTSRFDFANPLQPGVAFHINGFSRKSVWELTIETLEQVVKYVQSFYFQMLLLLALNIFHTLF